MNVNHQQYHHKISFRLDYIFDKFNRSKLFSIIDLKRG